MSYPSTVATIRIFYHTPEFSASLRVPKLSALLQQLLANSRLKAHLTSPRHEPTFKLNRTTALHIRRVDLPVAQLPLQINLAHGRATGVVQLARHQIVQHHAQNARIAIEIKLGHLGQRWVIAI